MAGHPSSAAGRGPRHTRQPALKTQTLYDARRTLREHLATGGHLEDWMDALNTFLTVDPRDAGCEPTLQRLHVFVEDVLAGRALDPAIAAHLRACPPCAEDCEALLGAWR